MKTNHIIRFAAIALLALEAAVGAGERRSQRPPEDCEAPFIREIQQASLAIRRDGTNAAAHFQRAEAYHELGKHAKAAADYSRAIALGATGGVAHLERAKCFNVMGRNQAALHDIQHAQELLPPSPLGYHRLADIHSDMGNYAEALDAFAEALTLSPTNARVLTCQARLFRKQGDLAAAERGFHAAIALDPQYVYAFHCRGLLFAAMGQDAKAVRDFTTVVDATPTCFLRRLQKNAYVARARSARRLGMDGCGLDLLNAARVAAKLKAIDRRIQAAEWATDEIAPAGADEK